MKQNVGLGLRQPFHNHILENQTNVPWFEVITENYLRFDGAPRNYLKKVAELYPLVFHGVSLSIGSLEPVRIDYVNQLKKLINEFQPLWVSDHLCWTYNGPENSHDLLPVPLTKKSLKRIIDKTLVVQDILKQKIYLENPSAYVDFNCNEYLEEDFISELCEKSGCGLLLDLNNIVVNKYNLGYEPLKYLDKVKNCEVRQIHLAGHTIKDSVRIDTHDSDISQEVLDLLPTAKKNWPNAQPMIEWDDKIPEIQYLLELRDKIENIWSMPSSEKPLTDINKDTKINNSQIKSETNHLENEKNTHQTFWQHLKDKNYISPEDINNSNILKNTCPTPAHVGMNVYSSAYYNRLVEVLEKDFPVLKVVLNDFFADVMFDYLKFYPSIYDSIDFVGNHLPEFILTEKFEYDFGVDQKIISDIAAFECLSGLSSIVFEDTHDALLVKNFTESDWLNKKIKLRSTVLTYEANCEIHPVIHAVQKNEIPEIPELIKCYYMFYRENNSTHFKIIDPDEYRLLNTFSEFKVFTDIIENADLDLKKYAELLIQNEKYFVIS